MPHITSFYKLNQVSGPAPRPCPAHIASGIQSQSSASRSEISQRAASRTGAATRGPREKGGRAGKPEPGRFPEGPHNGEPPAAMGRPSPICHRIGRAAGRRGGRGGGSGEGRARPRAQSLPGRRRARAGSTRLPGDDRCPHPPRRSSQVARRVPADRYAPPGGRLGEGVGAAVPTRPESAWAIRFSATIPRGPPRFLSVCRSSFARVCRARLAISAVATVSRLEIRSKTLRSQRRGKMLGQNFSVQFGES